MNFQVLYLIPPVISIITAGCIAAMGVYYRDKLRTENVMMSVICVLWAFLSISYVIQQFMVDRQSILVLERLTHLGLVWLPVIHVLFFEKILRIKKKLTLQVTLILTFLFSFGVFTPYYITGIKEFSWGYFAQTGPLFFMFLAFAVFVIVYIISHASKQLRKEKNSIVKIKFKYARFSFLCTALITLFTSLVTVGVDIYPPAYFVFLPLGFLGYGILRYRILGVWTILHISLRWLLVFIFTMIPNFLIFVLIRPQIIGLAPINHFLILLFWFLINYFLLKKINEHISQVIHIEGYDLKKIEVSFFKNIFYLRNIHELMDEFNNMMTTHLGFSHVDAFIASGAKGVYENMNHQHISVSPELEIWFVSFAKMVERQMVDEIPHFIEQREELMALLGSQDASYIVPLCQHEKLLSLAFIKDEYLKRFMTKSEIRLIDQLAVFVSIALYNSLVYRDISDLKDRLEEKTRNLSREIVERENAEKEIIKSQERYKFLADNVKDMIWVMEADTMKMTYVSPSVEKQLGYTIPEIMKLTLKDILNKASYEYVIKLRDHIRLNKQLYEREDLILELEMIRKDGTKVWVETSTHYLESVDDPKLLIGVSRDITERKKGEHEKKTMEAKLLQAQKMESIGVLAGGIAHDFNNILMAILGYTQLTRIYVPEENTEAHEKLSRIEKASFRAKDMVSQILAFSRQNDYVKLPVQLGTIIMEALNLLKGSLPSNINLVHGFEENLPSIMADPVQIHQVIINLCSNAAQAMEEKGGECRVSLSKYHMDNDEAKTLNLSPGLYVLLQVEDTGTGIGKDVMDRMFDPYFTTKEIGRGSGMGLAVVHGIVMSSGGKIRVDSEVGKGSRFDILFPAAARVVKNDDGEDTARDPARGNEHVLFVDDEKDICEFAKESLESMGYRVTTAPDGQTALNLVETRPEDFDVVITDLSMPDISGEKLAMDVRMLRSDLPVILCTGYNTYQPKKNTPANVITDILIKPVPSKDLADAIRSAIDLKKKY